MSPPKFIFSNPLPNVMVFGVGALKRRLVHKEGALTNGTGALIKDAPQNRFCLEAK
jgi:hypothetical protein